MSLFDLKVINSVLDQLEEERGIPREKTIEAIEQALATAYKKEYGKRSQIVRSKFNPQTGDVEFLQAKIVVDASNVRREEEETFEGDERIRYNPEQHIFIDDARRIKKGVELDEEITFPLEDMGDYGRIAAQTAKQVIIQKIREAEKVSVFEEFGKKEGDIVSGTVQRVERGSIYLDLGRATGVLAYEEQIPGERFRQGERVRAYLFAVDEGHRGVFLRLSRSHPRFLAKLFEVETPELQNGTVEIKAIAREPGSRSKIAVHSNDEHIDPVGSLVGQRGVRVSTVMSELGGEKIDIIEWSENPAEFVEDALSPAKVIGIELNEENHTAFVEVDSEQQSLAIGKAGQNVRLAAKLTGWKIDIHSAEGERVAETDGEEVALEAPEEVVGVADGAPSENNETPEVEATTEDAPKDAGENTETSEDETRNEDETKQNA